LEVDLDTGVARGTAVHVTRERAVPALIEYGVAPPATEPSDEVVVVAYRVAGVDLAGAQCNDFVAVPMQDAVLVADEAALEGLAQDATAQQTAAGEDGARWARAVIEQLAGGTGPAFDADGDGCPNLDELCAGTLFDAGAPPCR
jgi:hypothetical protein